MKIICRCEDIDEAEITALIGEGWITLEEIKRFSRAGMGHCQGRTCSSLIARLISKEVGKSFCEIKRNVSRPPIKPIAFKSLVGGKLFLSGKGHDKVEKNKRG